MKRIALAVLTVALIVSLLIGCSGPTTPTAIPLPMATSASQTHTSTVVTVGAWEQLSSFDGNASYLTIDPLNPQTLYASTVDSGVFKSTDGGVNWTQKLLNNAKERLIISGIESERLCTEFPARNA